jgi:hypothetical protein
MAAHSLGTTVVAGTGDAIASVDGQSISICVSVRKIGGRDRLDTGCAGWKVQPGLLVRPQLVEAACMLQPRQQAGGYFSLGSLRYGNTGSQSG